MISSSKRLRRLKRGKLVVCPMRKHAQIVEEQLEFPLANSPVLESLLASPQSLHQELYSPSALSGCASRDKDAQQGPSRLSIKDRSSTSKIQNKWKVFGSHHFQGAKRFSNLPTHPLWQLSKVSCATPYLSKMTRSASQDNFSSPWLPSVRIQWIFSLEPNLKRK